MEFCAFGQHSAKDIHLEGMMLCDVGLCVAALSNNGMGETIILILV
jgi:hypothetical protein